jgi:hypothetical protein
VGCLNTPFDHSQEIQYVDMVPDEIVFFFCEVPTGHLLELEHTHKQKEGDIPRSKITAPYICVASSCGIKIF